eukprot:TRINITY_DN12374_c0_g1_i2.p1 TRINITY_DN12374_c0_g1~~TRINITY_DN12374_c0_g1_i2.p1  ORF type:complete len:383 (+),score=108.43 TRINITY_DN12374_c0_g1_i2:80-1150(+)
MSAAGPVDVQTMPSGMLLQSENDYYDDEPHPSAESDFGLVESGILQLAALAADSRHENAELLAKLQEADEKLQDAHEANEFLQNELVTMAAERDDLQNQLQARSAGGSELQQLQKELGSERRAKQTFQKALSTKEAEVTALTQEIQKLTLQLESRTQRDTIKQTMDNFTSLKQQQEQSRSDITSTQVKELRQKLKEARDALAANKEREAAHQQAEQQYQLQVKELETQLAQAQEKSSDSKQSRAMQPQRDAHIAQLELHIQTLTAHVAQLEKANAASTVKLQSAEQLSQSQSGDASDELRKQLAKKDQQLGQLMTQVKEWQTNIMKLTQEVQTMRKQRKSDAELIAQLRAENDSLR